MVWPAISQLYTLGLIELGLEELAWKNIVQSLYQTHADAFPTVWMGQLSGPDGWIPTLEPNTTGYEGGTWESVVTPMIDFPVTNMNPDAMYLNSLFAVVGVSVANGGIMVNCTSESNLSTPLLSLTCQNDVVLFSYTPFNLGTLSLSFWVGDWTPKCLINTIAVPCTPENGLLEFQLDLAESTINIKLQ
jgi:hypothetical protein